MKHYLSSFMALAAVCIFIACKKEKTTWDGDYTLPIAHTNLTLQNLLPDSMLQIDNNNVVSVDMHRKIVGFTVADLLKAPATALADTIKSPAINLVVSAGASLSNIIANKHLNIAGTSLRTLVLDHAALEVEFQNFIHEKLTINYTVNTSTEQATGVPFVYNATVDAAPDNVLFSTNFFQKNLEQTTFHMTGANNLDYNAYQTSMSAVVNPAATASINISPKSVIGVLKTSFKDLKIKYAEGYLGHQEGEKEGDIAIDALQNVQSGSLDIANMNLDLNLKNTIGADAQIIITELVGINEHTGVAIPLQHTSIPGAININRAIKNSDNTAAIASNYGISFTANNSNLAAVLSNMPTKFHYKIKAVLNPFGNVAGSQDFVYGSSGVEVDLHLYGLNSMAAHQLTIADTIDAVISDNEFWTNLQQGSIKLLATNTIPHELSVSVVALDANGNYLQEIVANQTIQPASFASNSTTMGMTIPQKSTVLIPISPATKNNLLKTKKLIIKARLHTTNGATLPWYSFYGLDIHLIAQGVYTQHL